MLKGEEEVHLQTEAALDALTAGAAKRRQSAAKEFTQKPVHFFTAESDWTRPYSW